jgi:hypothetical protein
MNWFNRPHCFNGRLFNTQTLATAIPLLIVLAFGAGLAIQAFSMTHAVWTEKSARDSVSKQLRAEAVRPLCVSHAESNFRYGVEIYLDSQSRTSSDGLTLFWPFDANTRNGFDIPVTYHGVCIAESDGRGGTKIHITNVEQDQ